MFRKDSQGPEESSRQGSLLLGLIGASLGALLTMEAAVLFWTLAPSSQRGSAFLWLMILTAPAAGLGYRLFRGRRSRRAALATVIPVTLLACALTTPAMVLSTVCQEARARDLPLSAVLGTVSLGEFLRQAMVRGWQLTAICCALGAFGLLVFRGAALNYADWERAPWRAAYAGGNGALYNAPPQFLPARNLPKSFRVGGKLEVDGETLRTLPLLGRGRTFHAKDVAGVIIGPSTGCNVLYSRDNEVLAKFAWSMYGADMLIAYLLDRKVPIQAPPHLGPLFRPEAPLRGELPDQFALSMSSAAVKALRRVGIAFLTVSLLLLAALTAFWQMELLPGALYAVLMCGALFPGLAGLIFLYARNKHRLEINGEQLLFVSRTGRRKRFTAGDIGSASWHGSFYEIQDKNWKRLALLDPGLENLELLEPYMRKRCPEMSVRESPIRRR